MTRKGRRLVFISTCACVLAISSGLVLSALHDTIIFFRSPSEVVGLTISPGTRFRVGGLVEPGSVERAGTFATFAVTDGGAAVRVSYSGMIPDLFREGQGVVVEGVMQADGNFKADSVLAKHDETYMPREVADALKKQGHWQDAKSGGPTTGQPRPGN